MAESNSRTIILFNWIIIGFLLTSEITEGLAAEATILDQYLGCFYQNVTQTIGGDVLRSNNLTIENCIQHCGGSGNTNSYARIQNGTECYCVDEYGLQLNDSLCNKLCGGNPSQYCSGSYGALSTYVLYTVCPIGWYGPGCDKTCHCERQTPCLRHNGTCRNNSCHGNYTGTACNELKSFSDQYIGCYKDKGSTDRAMTTDAMFATDNKYNSLQKCIDTCSSNSSSYSGPQYAYQCFCGESYDRHGTNGANCDSKCSGNENQICGGGNALSVYHSCPAGNYGRKCSKVCNCEVGVRCFFQNGTCNTTGCKPGWTDNACALRDCNVNNGDCNTGELCVKVEPIKSRSIFVCRCPNGYRKMTAEKNCTDINECSEMPGICGPYAMSCSNIEGSYICHCPNGSNVTTPLCTADKNECRDFPGICGPYAKSCSNIEGSYICHCLNGNNVTNSSCSSDVVREHYLGCYYNTETKWKNSKELTNVGDNSRKFEHCIEFCNKSENSYAMIQNGTICRCVDELGLQLNDTLCNKSCGENSSEYCEGVLYDLLPTYILYTVCPFGSYGSKCEKACHCEQQAPCNRKTGKCPNGCHGNYTEPACDKLNENSFSYQYIGCYKDDSKNGGRNRAMTDAKFTPNNDYNSLQLCTDTCSSKPNSYSGPQYHYQCYCGESYDKHGRLNEVNCSTKCSGNQNQICGGSDALSVYHSCPAGNYGYNCTKVCNCEVGVRCFFQNGTCNTTGCKPGWTGYTCALRDCKVSNGDCNTGESCVTVEPIKSREISVCRCPDGYGKLTPGAKCTEIDECKEIPGICGPYATSCSKIPGSYMCHCQNGSNVTTSLCTSDINECTEYPGICGPYARSCSNIEGSYVCHCLEGNNVTGAPCSDFLTEHYLGCFYIDETKWENETDGLELSKDNHPLERCVEHCRNSTTSESYVRLRNGSFCECVSETGLQLNESDCNKTCRGNQSYYCGGVHHDIYPTYTLYTVCPFGTYGMRCEKVCHCEQQVACNRLTGKCPNGLCHGNYTGDSCEKLTSVSGQFIGCYEDVNTGIRAMSHESGFQKSNISGELCTDWCSSKNYPFSETQVGSQCSCGWSYKKYGSSNDSDCSKSCSGIQTEACGGGNALSVYNSCPSGSYGHKCAKVCNCEKGRCYFHNGTCLIGGCKPGWIGDTCVSRDCSVSKGDCDEGELCIKVEPVMSRTISVCRCPEGYGKRTTGAKCTDINECLEFPNICGPFATSCSNTEGSYICHCQNGNNVTTSLCTSDINECMNNSDICGPHAQACINIEGSYMCQCRNGINVTNAACKKPTDAEGHGIGVVAVIVPLFFVIAILVVVVVVYFHRSQLPKKENAGKNSVGMTPRRPSEGPPIYEVVLTSKPISTDKLPDFIKSKLSAPDLLGEEFKSVPQETKDTCSAGKNPNLKEKNRFKNIIPYDHNRVILQKVGNSVLSDYINASHIFTFNPSDKFIATQGPKPETVNDFWRLICEQNVGLIVMITNLVENLKVKCEKYWPDVGSSLIFGEISVETQSEEHYNDYLVRRLFVENDTKNMNVIQLHFLPWPDHGVPSDVNSFLNFRKRARKCMTPGKSVAVHCSAGAGRTGCFIAIDYLLEQERHEGKVDIYACLRHLRKLRCQMVQTLIQYQFIHRALLLSVSVGETSVPTAKYAARLKELNAVISGKGLCPLDVHYQFLQESKDDLSGSNYSQVLSKSPNASKISEMDPAYTWGWKTKDVFITLNPPTSQTVEDFYELCNECNCKVIIVIDAEKVLDREVFPVSKNVNLRQKVVSRVSSSKADYGISYRISERKLSDDTYANFGQFDIYANTVSVQESGGKEMHVLHLTESVINDTIGFQSLISLHRSLKELSEGGNNCPTLVISRNGYKLSGYCLAALNAFDMCADEKEVDVFQTVQEIRKSRKQFDFSLSAFRELHSTVGQFIQASV